MLLVTIIPILGGWLYQILLAHTQAISQHEQGQSQRGSHTAHSELLTDAGDARGVYRRADVDSKRQKPY